MNDLDNIVGVLGGTPLSNSGHEFKVIPISVQFCGFFLAEFSRTGIGIENRDRFNQSGGLAN